MSDGEGGFLGYHKLHWSFGCQLVIAENNRLGVLVSLQGLGAWAVEKEGLTDGQVSAKATVKLVPVACIARGKSNDSYSRGTSNG